MASIAAAIGDPVRVNMLMALRMDGALTAGELADVGNVAPSTASEHLSKMQMANLVTQQKIGRKRLYTLSGDNVCELLDGVEAMARSQTDAGVNVPVLDGALLHVRRCYHHLAGRAGCDITNAMFADKLLAHDRAGPDLTNKGKSWIKKFDIDPDDLESTPRTTVRLCQDWTDRRHHLGGALGSALFDGFRRRDWIRVTRGSSHVLITPKGFSGFKTDLGVDLRQAA